MSHEVTESEERTSKGVEGISRKIGTVGWGLFFIWVGLSTLADLGWGVGFLGVAAVVFLMQAVRRFFSLGIEPFWLVVGGAFFFGGIWHLYQVEVSLVPFALILIGCGLLFSLFRSRRFSRRCCRR